MAAVAAAASKYPMNTKKQSCIIIGDTSMTNPSGIDKVTIQVLLFRRERTTPPFYTACLSTSSQVCPFNGISGKKGKYKLPAGLEAVHPQMRQLFWNEVRGGEGRGGARDGGLAVMLLLSLLPRHCRVVS